MLTESRRKWLTGYIGECWHEWMTTPYDTDTIYRPCIHCRELRFRAAKSIGQDEYGDGRRTFTTGNDMVKVMEAIQEKGEWGAFLVFSWDIAIKTEGEELISVPRFTTWLINPSRLPELVFRWKGVE